MNKKMETNVLVIGGILAACIVVLQYISNFVKVGPVNITLVQIPIIIGVATCGIKMGAWLGGVFGFIVLISGASEPFFSWNPVATILICMLKGICAGVAAGWVYSLLARFNRYLGVISAAVVSPLVNTGIFFLGCFIFFMENLQVKATEAGMGDNIIMFMFLGLAGINFIVEFSSNVLLSPIVKRLLDVRKKQG